MGRVVKRGERFAERGRKKDGSKERERKGERV